MKKIGIMTFNNSYNFGAALQAFALKTVINELGYEAHVIDFTVISDYERYNPAIFSSGILLAPVKIKDYSKNSKRKILFSAFRDKYLDLSEKKYTDADDLTELNNDYDIFITGSDQVWNIKLTNGIIGGFFLSFVKEKKKIAYAPSLGLGEQEFVENGCIINKLLSSFESLSCREKSGALKIEEVTERKIPVVLDPTLLVRKEVYKQIASKYKGKSGKYILVYTFGKIDMTYIFKLAANKNLEIKCYTRLYKPFVYDWFASTGPAEFIDLISNAEYVITNSFHGTIFSILMEKQFCIYSLPENDTRIRPMIDRFRLESRIYRENFNIDDPIDYKNVHNIIELEKLASIEFLKSSLEK